MQLTALLCLVLAPHVVGNVSSPRLRSGHHAAVNEPLPSAYTPWRPDPNEINDVLSGKTVLTQKHKHKKGAKAGSDDDDDDDFPDMSRFFKVREPKQTFKMDESATILYEMMGQFDKPTFLQWSASEAKDHKLSDAKQASVVLALRTGLSGFQAGGHDFMLDAARANHPGMTEKQQRGRLIDMLQVMLKNATKATPAKTAKKNFAAMAKAATGQSLK